MNAQKVVVYLLLSAEKLKEIEKKNEFIVSFLNEDVTANYLIFLKIQENRAVSKDENDKLTICIISLENYSSRIKIIF